MHDSSRTPARRSTPLPLDAIAIDDAFWSPRIATVREQTIPFQYHQLETVGHLRSLLHDPQSGDPTPHIFWDSDIAKWIEAASYSLISHPDPALDARIDEVIALLAAAQQPDGYLNTYFTVVEPEGRWSDLRDAHELYCAGHLIEAGVAHHAATGKTSLLGIVQRYANLIANVFGSGERQLPGYDGHEEIELALVKLARATGERRYLELAAYFVEQRGREPYYFDLEEQRRGTPGWFADHFPGEGHLGRRREYVQAHAPIREQHEAVGHAVRAMYLYSAVADLARELDDDSLLETCRTLWHHLTTRRMYVTGGIGTSAVNEGFTEDFDLPTETAYAETCAAIGLMMWAQRMLGIDRHRRYSDVLELALYNGVLAGMSSEGTCFFYDNPLASLGGVDRHEWFEVACCPPNLARLLASLGSYAYAIGEDELVVHLAVAGTLRVPTGGGTAVIAVSSNLPWSGDFGVRIETAASTPMALTMRIPAWSTEPSLTVNGQTEPVLTGTDGYLVLKRQWIDGDEILLDLGAAPRRLRPDPRLISEAGQVVVAKGPLIYALEEADNGAALHQLYLPEASNITVTAADGLPGIWALTAAGVRRSIPGEGLYRTTAPSEEIADLLFVPYFAWANRGPGEMRVWLAER